MVFKDCDVICWPTKDHTPYPEYAIDIPTTPLDIVEINVILVWVLKFIAFVRRALCTIPNALMITIEDITCVSETNSGRLKNVAINGALKNKAADIIIESTRLM